MKRIDLEAYQQILASATVLERDAYGEKVLRLPDDRLVKLFRRKRWLSSALLFPYALRFVRNAARLKALQIPTVKVVDLAHCAAAQRHLVTYEPLPGETLRTVLRDPATALVSEIDSLARFVAQLHEKGVYFRSVHFGNIIVLPDGCTLGLIDVADMVVRRGTLPVRERLRNFRHMLRYAEDVAALKRRGWADFVECYLAATSLADNDRFALRQALLHLPEISA